jgi:hypothetical protein
VLSVFRQIAFIQDNSYRCYLLIWIARQLLVIWFWSLHLLFKSLLSGESGLLQSNLAEFSEQSDMATSN